MKKIVILGVSTVVCLGFLSADTALYVDAQNKNKNHFTGVSINASAKEYEVLPNVQNVNYSQKEIMEDYENVSSRKNTIDTEKHLTDFNNYMRKQIENSNSKLNNSAKIVPQVFVNGANSIISNKQSEIKIDIENIKREISFEKSMIKVYEQQNYDLVHNIYPEKYTFTDDIINFDDMRKEVENVQKQQDQMEKDYDAIEYEEFDKPNYELPKFEKVVIEKPNIVIDKTLDYKPIDKTQFKQYQFEDIPGYTENYNKFMEKFNAMKDEILKDDTTTPTTPTTP